MFLNNTYSHPKKHRSVLGKCIGSRALIRLSSTSAYLFSHHFFFFTDKHQMANVLFLVRKKKRLCANTT